VDKSHQIYRIDKIGMTVAFQERRITNTTVGIGSSNKEEICKLSDAAKRSVDNVLVFIINGPYAIHSRVF